MKSARNEQRMVCFIEGADDIQRVVAVLRDLSLHSSVAASRIASWRGVEMVCVSLGMGGKENTWVFVVIINFETPDGKLRPMDECCPCWKPVTSRQPLELFLYHAQLNVLLLPLNCCQAQNFQPAHCHFICRCNPSRLAIS